MTTVLVFDSGIGGMSVLREIHAMLPGVRLVYVADDAAFPYGGWHAGTLRDHIADLFAGLIETHAPDLAVIACNTASTLVLPVLRARFDIPFVGTVPAIKPAASRTKSGLVTVLATPGTVQREYTFDLIRKFAPEVAITLVGSENLAALAETHIGGGKVTKAQILDEISPCFVEKDGRRTDVVVLACTHYPLLTRRFRAAALWPVRWLDPAKAIARRVRSLVPEPDAAPDDGENVAIFTSGRAPTGELAAFFARYGLASGESLSSANTAFDRPGAVG